MLIAINNTETLNIMHPSQARQKRSDNCKNTMFLWKIDIGKQRARERERRRRKRDGASTLNDFVIRMLMTFGWHSIDTDANSFIEKIRILMPIATRLNFKYNSFCRITALPPLYQTEKIRKNSMEKAKTEQRQINMIYIEASCFCPRKLCG